MIHAVARAMRLGLIGALPCLPAAAQAPASPVPASPVPASPVPASQAANLHPRIVKVRMSDGVELAVALYLPAQPGRFPALLAASPYRIDNDAAPSVPAFPFRETGPIAWYVGRGYAFVRVDVRGTGRSGGVYRYQDAREQRDLYEMVEWIARQPWSTGKVGGIGQSYYARSQWFAAAEAPPHLACVAPYDGNIDTYRASAYTGGIPGGYPQIWYDVVTRGINLHPFAGKPRDLPFDYAQAMGQHPLYDAFWRERSVAERLDRVKIPVFSIGVWGKVDLHLNGNIVGYQRVAGPKKLLVLGGAGVDEAVAEYSSVAFHQQYLAPFYDWCLKGENTGWLNEPAVRYTVTGSDVVRTAPSWPPPDAAWHSFYLSSAHSGSVTSLNDGSLVDAAAPSDAAPGDAAPGDAATVLHYPDPAWGQSGVVVRDKDGRPDTARRVLTFTSAPFDADTTVAGPSRLTVWIASSRDDADLFVKVYEQFPEAAADRAKGVQPRARIVTKGWLRASMRAIDAAQSLPNAPWYSDDHPQPLVPGQATRLDVAIMPTAALFHRGSRLRIEVAPGDSALTEGIFAHPYFPDQVGTMTILHDAAHPSVLVVPEVQ